MELIPSIDDVFQAAQSGDASRLQDMLTPLGLAVRQGNERVAELLRRHGARL